MAFGSKSQNPVWRQKTGRKAQDPGGCGGGWVQPRPPPIGVSPGGSARVTPAPGSAPGQPWSSVEASPPLQRSGLGHSHFSPASRGTATHPTLPHAGAPLGDAAAHPHPGELLQLLPNNQKLGFCLQSAIPGFSHVWYKLWLLTADYVFKSTLVEQQAAAGRQGAGTQVMGDCCLGSLQGGTSKVLPRPGTCRRRLESDLRAEATSGRLGGRGESHGAGSKWDAGGDQRGRAGGSVFQHGVQGTALGAPLGCRSILALSGEGAPSPLPELKG